MADKEAAPQCESEGVETPEVKQIEGKGGSPKSSPSKIETNEALQHLVQGKRHLLVRDVNSAVNSLQEACRLLAEQYGETADPCGEAYFFYGKALLELSRIETGVLGNALDGVPDGDDADTSQTEDPDKLSEEEKQKVVEEVDEALEENFTTLENARKSNQASEGKAASKAEAAIEGAKRGEVELKTASEVDKIVDNGVDMETGGEEVAVVFEKPVGSSDVHPADNTIVDSEVTKDDEKKSEPEPIDEVMEVDGAVLSSASGVAAAPTDSAAGDGTGRSGEIEPSTASEAKTAASGEGDGELAKTAGSRDAEMTEKGTATGDGKRRSWEIETPPAASEAKNISGGSSVESAKTTEPEDVEMNEKENAAAAEGRQSSREMEAPLAASETKEVASGESHTKTAEPGDAEMVEKKPDVAGDGRRRSWEIETPPAASEAKKTSAGDGEVEDKPLLNNGDSADSRPKDETAADKAADVRPAVAVDADTLPAEKTSDAALVTKTANASAVETDSREASVTEKTTEKEVNGHKPGESTEGDEEDGEEGDGEDQSAEAEDAEKEETEGEAKEGDGETAEGEEEEGDAAKEGDTSQDCDTEEGEGEGEGEGAKEGEDEEEDVPNIQLAWEVLELAKIIFTRQAKDKPSDLKLSEVYQKLGEVSIEAENYSQAVDDLNNCLAIQKKHLEADDRLIAETHYHLGVAHSLANQYSEAIAAFQASVDTILARVQRLQRQIIDREQGKKIEHEDPFYKEENEIKELEGLLPDMKEKIADMRDMKSEAQKKIAEIFAAGGGAGPSTSAAPISPVKAMMTSRPAASAADSEGGKKETHSIGHLVKRKRLSDPTDEEAKRAKQENGHNGINGQAEPA